MQRADVQVKRGDAGIFTAEGNVAGRRAAGLAKKREKEKAEFEKAKQDFRDAGEKTAVRRIGDKFNAERNNAVEQDFQAQTYGLKTKAEFHAAVVRNPPRHALPGTE